MISGFTTTDLQPVLALARSAGQAAMQYYGRDAGVTQKSDESPLTLADLASHRTIVETLQRTFPEIPVVSEEDAQRADAALRAAPRYWLVDPLDGTKEFLKRTGTFTVNIGLIEQGRPIAGVIHVPALDETYWATRAGGAWKQAGRSAPERIQTSPSGVPLRFVASRDHAGPEVAALLKRFPNSECLSIGSSLKFCLVAEGRADAYLRDVPTMEWDTAAAQAIVETAGGVLLTYPQLQPLTYGKDEWRNGSLLTVGRADLAARLVP